MSTTSRGQIKASVTQYNQCKSVKNI